jgi:hypothetical protein
MGFRGKVSRSTLADANESHDWRIYADFAQVLIHSARPMYASESLGFDLDNTVYALDSTTIDLCLSVFPWARFRSRKGAVKMHSLLDLRGPIPTFIEVSDGKMADVKIRVRSDQTVVLASDSGRKNYPATLRRIHYYDAEQDRHIRFLTNNFDLPALTICLLYKSRWQVELFFKWIKQHLRIKVFYGTSENAVKTQIWVAISIYVLIAIVKKRHELEPSLFQILQILSITVFEKVPIPQAFGEVEPQEEYPRISKQLNLLGL